MDSMDKPLPNDDPTVTLTIRLIMQGKVCTEHIPNHVNLIHLPHKTGMSLLKLAVTIQELF
jgi:hypothetical protein